jgi:F0F1-type ATP synthase assembly protein I
MSRGKFEVRSAKSEVKSGRKNQAQMPVTETYNGATAGTDLAASIIVGLALGYGCQRFLPWSRPWGFLIFLFLGIAAGFWQLFKSQPAGRKEKK